MSNVMQLKHHLIEGNAGDLSRKSPENDEESARWMDPRIERHEDIRRTCRDCFDGTTAIKAGGERYLPRLPRETTDGWKLRRDDSPFYNFYGATVRASTGLVFNRDPSWNADTPEPIKLWWDDVTGEGTKGSVFFRDAFESALVGGFAIVLVDYPEVPAGESLAEERAANRKPYVTLYPAHHILSFRHEKRGGAMRLSQLALLEYVHEAKGSFGRTVTEQVRVYRRGGQGIVSVELFRPKKVREKVKWVSMGPPAVISGVSEIPAVEITTRPSMGFAAAQPPLADVAHLNLAHYRTNSHRRWAMTATCYPLPIRVGYVMPDVGESERSVGPTFAMDLPPGGSFGYAAPPDSAFRPTGEEMDRIQQGIAVLALSYLAGESRIAETATARRISVKAQDATLLVAAKALADAMNEIVYFVGQFLGVDVKPNTAMVTVDFRASMLDDHTIQTLWTVTQGGGLSMETFLKSLATGTLPEDFDVNGELLRITADMQERQERANEQLEAQTQITADSQKQETKEKAEE